MSAAGGSSGGEGAAPRAPGVVRVIVVVKGYPRLSETFVAQELVGLEARGVALAVWSMRRPTDGAVHDLHRRLRAPVHYLPEYLRDDPARVARGALAALRRPVRLARLLALFAGDLARDPTANRLRRLGQALVLAREAGSDEAGPAGLVLAHFLHTPGSVARYASLLLGLPYALSAHARDIWTTPDREVAGKLAGAAYAVTCTEAGRARLASLAPPGRVSLAYHGLDLARFPPAPPPRPPRDGRDPADPLRLLTVARLVEKKGLDDLLEALALLPPGLHWRLVQVGSGPLRGPLAARAAALGIAERIAWRGGLAQDGVIAALREADLFVLPSRAAGDGDRDGLPNVLMEAASQGLPLLATRFAAIPEFLRDGVEGRLVPPADPPALAAGLAGLASDPAARARLGEGARRRLAAFGADEGLDRVEGLIRRAVGEAARGGTDRAALPRAAE